MVAAIRTVGLAESFGATVALRPLDLEVAEGGVLGYLGPDGAGKTTTIRCLPGMGRASAGRGEIVGVDAQADPAQAHRGWPMCRGRRTCGRGWPAARRCTCWAASRGRPARAAGTS